MNGQSLDPFSSYLEKNMKKVEDVITGCCYNDIYGEKAIPDCFHPVISPFPTFCLKIEFLAIFSQFVSASGQPFDSSFDFIERNIITGCC